VGAFNLVPGFPLDGGRVLRAILWRAKGNLQWATRVASRAGSTFGLVLIATRTPKTLAAFAVGACGDDDDTPGRSGDAGPSDAKSDGRADTSTPTPDARDTGAGDRDAGTTGDASDGGSTPEAGGEAGDAGPTPAQRGEYLVKTVGACGDCHTTRSIITGQPDPAKFLGGMPGFFQIPGLQPDGGVGVIGTPNLTSDMTTGLGSWTDMQIKAAFLDGVDKDGNALFPIMPYYVLHNMSASDADAIVAYLRTVPAVSNAIPDRNFALPAASPPVPADRIPNPTLAMTDPDYASAMRGKYLAGNIGLCMQCHTWISRWDQDPMASRPVESWRRSSEYCSGNGPTSWWSWAM